jgi:hypothetical protein
MSTQATSIVGDGGNLGIDNDPMLQRPVENDYQREARERRERTANARQTIRFNVSAAAYRRAATLLEHQLAILSLEPEAREQALRKELSAAMLAETFRQVADVMLTQNNDDVEDWTSVLYDVLYHAKDVTRDIIYNLSRSS